MWLVIAIAAFFLLVFVGRQVRLGRLKTGPWFRQFRTLRSLLGLAALVLAISLMMRGEVWPAIGALVLSLVLTGSVRVQAHFRAGSHAPPTAAAFSSEEIQAYQTLDLSIGSDKKAVKEAWKRLMKSAHPDHGGDVKRASALNAARDLLLRRRR